MKMYEVTYDSGGRIRSIGKIDTRWIADLAHPPDGVLYTETLPEGSDIPRQYKIQNGVFVDAPEETKEDKTEEEVTYP